MNGDALILWSRAQFALTACYHWLFVPLTLGLGVIMAIAETIYHRTDKPEWKRWAMFWQKLFGINFAIGVATGIILEFEFGTNWSNYSWLVGDIFGAPLAIEGILAFFMEATFIAVMFFGWNKVSRRFHLASTWLTIIGATISAVWILVANAWMQDPVGVYFNPDTVRSEMVDFWKIVFSPTAINKFWHTVSSSWVLGSVFAAGVCSIYMLRGKHKDFAVRNFKMIAPFGLIASIITAATGDTSAYNVAQKQPMKFAAMEALYEAGESTPDGRTLDGKGLPLSALGMIASDKTEPLMSDDQSAYAFNIGVPRMLSIMATHTVDGYVPGVNNILKGGYYAKENGQYVKQLSADEKIAKGRQAVTALKYYTDAKKINDSEAMAVHAETIQNNFQYFGYGYIKDKKELVPNVYLSYYTFRLMVGLGGLFILLFLLGVLFTRKKNMNSLPSKKWFLILTTICMPLVWLASQSGWILAELGRQPWAIQDMLPLSAAVSDLQASTVVLTFTLFAILFTILLIAELNIMIKSINQGPESDKNDVETLIKK